MTTEKQAPDHDDGYRRMDDEPPPGMLPDGKLDVLDPNDPEVKRRLEKHKSKG